MHDGDIVGDIVGASDIVGESDVVGAGDVVGDDVIIMPPPHTQHASLAV